LFKIKARYVGAYGSEFLAARNLSYQECLEQIDAIQNHIASVLKSDTNTRKLNVKINRIADNATIYIVDPSKQFRSTKLLCVLQILSEDE
jgi:hypothetical protein